MNVKTMAISIITVMVVLAMITTTAMACFESCGTKIEQCTDGTVTKDATYALVLPAVTPGVPIMRFAYVDGDGNLAFDPGECAYIDTNAGGPAWVGAGDIRLCGHCGEDPNNPVLVCDPNEIGNTFTYPAQTIVGYVDSNTNGYYDIDDPLYLDVGAVGPNGIVSVGDIRLTGYMGFGPYTVVNASEIDALFAFPLLDPATRAPLPTANAFNSYLGFVDTACDNRWDATGEDKLYLQQIVIGNGGATPFLPLAPAALYPFEGFVTIGDFRLYMPPDEPCWPDCGTKVKQCDEDAVYPLLVQGDIPRTTAVAIPVMALRWVDAQIGDAFNPAVDDVYIDTNGVGPRVEYGDVRLTSVCGCPPNTLVGQCDDCDVNAAFAIPVAPDQNIVGFVDANGNGRYDLDDPLYVDTSRLGVGATGANVVSINAIRLTPRDSYGAYSVVEAGATDLLGDIVLRDIATALHPPIPSANPINSYLGFVDTNCDGQWATDGTDKLYLQQLVFPILPGPTAPGPNQFDRFASIGDFRLYMPIDEPCWPDCGTKVEQCDEDAVYGLLPGVGAALINGVILPMNIVTTSRGCVYVNVYGHAVTTPIGPGAVRLCECCGMDPNTVVKDCDCDANDPIVPVLPPQNILGYVDVNSNGIYDMEDPLYLDLGRVGIGSVGVVSARDIRLTPRDCQGNHYDAYTRVASNDWDAGHGSGTGDTLQCPATNLAVLLPVVNVYLGFIDSNCDGMWDVNGNDELYLQQLVAVPLFAEPQFNLFSTIGDFRLYIPPNSSGPSGPIDLYDANDNGYIDKDELKTAIYDYLTTPIGTVISKDDLKTLIYDYLDHL